MPPKTQDERAADIAQKSESMARELSQKREMRIRQERVRQLSLENAPPPLKTRTPPGQEKGDDKTLRVEGDTRVDPAPTERPERGERAGERVEHGRERDPAFFPHKRASMLDDVAVELEELLRDLRAGWRRFAGADRITFLAALAVLAGVLMPWTSDKVRFYLGITSGGVIHAALAVVAIALCVGRFRRTDGSGERLSARDRLQRARRASIWHLLLGAASTALCAFFLVLYGLQRTAETSLEIRYGLYVTLAAGMGLSYGGFARFWSRHDADR